MLPSIKFYSKENRGGSFGGVRRELSFQSCNARYCDNRLITRLNSSVKLVTFFYSAFPFHQESYATPDLGTRDNFCAQGVEIERSTHAYLK